MPDPEWFQRSRTPERPRQRTPGEEVWRLFHRGHVQTCELRDDSTAGAGWDVLLLEDGEPLFLRRCAFESEARYVARAFKQDNLRGGWIDAEANASQEP
jgi:hypothetical protein